MLYLYCDIEWYKSRVDITEYLFYTSLKDIEILTEPRKLPEDSYVILISNFYRELYNFGIQRDHIILFIWDLYCTKDDDCICSKCKFQTVVGYINCYGIKHVMYRFDTIITRLQLMANTNIFTYKFPYFIPEINLNHKKDIDVLFYGAVYPTVYPFRRRLLDILEKTTDVNIKIIYPGQKHHAVIKPPELYDWINRSWLVVATSSIMNCLLLKYYEIAACNSVVVGNYPKYEPHTPLSNNIVQITNEMKNEGIINTIKSALSNKEKLIEISNNAKSYVNSKYLFKHGQELLNNIHKQVQLNNTLVILYKPFNGIHTTLEPRVVDVVLNEKAQKICVSFFNCHGSEYLIQLQQCPTFYNTYRCYSIYNVKYLNCDISNRHKKLISKADLLILQYINNNRQYIHHDVIKKLCKKECIIILLPHYTFSGYITDTEKELDAFKRFDEISTIKMYDLFTLNYKNTRLFQSRSYPSDMFFYLVALQILRYIYWPSCKSKRELRNIVDKTTYIKTNFAANTKDIILKDTGFSFYDEDEIYCGQKFSVESLLKTKETQGNLYRNVPGIFSDIVKNEANKAKRNMDYV